MGFLAMVNLASRNQMEESDYYIISIIIYIYIYLDIDIDGCLVSKRICLLLSRSMGRWLGFPKFSTLTQPKLTIVS